MQRKYKIILGGIIVLIIICIVPLHTQYATGDVSGGPKVLHYPFLKNKSLCTIVGGNYKLAIRGWSNNKFNKYCLVKSPFICNLFGGKIGPSDPEVYLVDTAPSEACRKY